MKDTNKKKKNDEEVIENLEELIDDEKEEQELDEENEEVEDVEVVKLQEKVKDLENQLRRAVADYRNLEKRVSDERIEFVKFANKNLLEQLLPAFDTLLLASKYSEDQNLQVTAKYLLDVLKQAGVEKVKTEDVKFDPATMEAIEVIDGEDGKVIEETQPGFLLNGKIIRPARVKVGGISNK